MNRLLVFLLTAFLTSISSADEAAVKKFKDFTPEQIRKLPEKVIQGELPIMYSQAASRGLSEGSELLFGMELNLLMYPGIHDYDRAVRAFQRDLGDQQNGTLTVWQIHNLEQRAAMQKLGRLLFPERFSSTKNDEFASVTGTVIIVDEKIAWPINHVRVRCGRQQNYCEVDQLSISTPSMTSWSQNYYVGLHDTEYYPITRWDSQSIDAGPLVTSGECRTTSLNLNFKTQEFYYVTRNAGGNCESLGIEFEKLSKPRISQIVDGSKIIPGEFSKVEKAAYDLLSSEFRSRVEKLNAR